MYKWASALLMALALTACDDRVESHFQRFEDIPECSGIWSWLPVFFPSSATEIAMTTNLDIDLFYVEFRLTRYEDRQRFEAELGEENVVNDADGQQKSWCRKGKTIWNSEAEAQPFFITKTSAERYLITNDKPGCRNAF